MTKRYDSKQILENSEDTYEDVFENRGVSHIRQYGSPNMTHLTVDQIRELDRVGHVWKVGDRFYKLSHKYYGDAKYWWVIAWFNKKPTESHVEFGEVIYIPLPLERVLQYYDVV